MTLSRLLTCILTVCLATGCSQIQRHDIDISGQLREQPVKSITLLPPVFPSSLERNHPDDFPELLPENTENTAAEILRQLRQAIGSSISTDSDFVPNEETLAWNSKIGNELIIERVPLSVPPVDFAAESVLIVAAIDYGTELNQYSYQLFPFLRGSKRRYFGKPRRDHVCDLAVLLIRPRDGFILCHVRHGEIETANGQDPNLLKDITTKTAQVIGRARRAERGP